MRDEPQSRVTELLSELGAGNPRASEELLPLVYDELRRLARAKMSRESPGHTLQPTALVHEAYLRLVKDEGIGWQNRAHFFGAAAEAMRRILIERARRYGRKKHGGEQRRTTLGDHAPLAGEPDPEELLDLDRALGSLEARDPAMANVVKLRCFAGFSVEETAEVLGSSPRTVKRHWAAARTWLHREMSRAGAVE